MTQFKPMLAIDASNHLNDISYPKFASCKLDGIRCIFHPELGMVSRSLKPIPNKQLNEKFKDLLAIAKHLGVIFDGELYAHKLTFQEITRAVMTQDFNDEQTFKKLSKDFDSPKEYIKHLIDSMQFVCFDVLMSDIPDLLFHERLPAISRDYGKHVISLQQRQVNNSTDVKKLFCKALDSGFEGLILRDPDSPYKFGRSTLKKGYMLKVKPFETFDAAIIGVEQATVVCEDVKKKFNELGYSVTSRKKDDRVLIEKPSAFWVKYNDMELKVSLAMTDSEKEKVWKNQDSYIGRMIEYKGMLVGSKDVPRHPVFVRFREDKDD